MSKPIARRAGWAASTTLARCCAGAKIFGGPKPPRGHCEFSCPIHVNLIAPLYPGFRAMQKHADEGS
jgi:hypothetical protein